MNANRSVDLTNLLTVLNNFGTTTRRRTQGNFDNTVSIDPTDLADVLNNSGATNPSASFAPRSRPQFGPGDGVM